MADVEKVVTGLNCCLAVKNAGTETCFECPYKEQDGKDSTPCEDYLMQESLVIIIEQVYLKLQIIFSLVVILLQKTSLFYSIIILLM